jgi:hypothetical protein
MAQECMPCRRSAATCSCCYSCSSFGGCAVSHPDILVSLLSLVETTMPSSVYSHVPEALRKPRSPLDSINGQILTSML